MVTLDHLILTVNDRDASVRFYTEVMGFEGRKAALKELDACREAFRQDDAES